MHVCPFFFLFYATCRESTFPFEFSVELVSSPATYKITVDHKEGNKEKEAGFKGLLLEAGPEHEIEWIEYDGLNYHTLPDCTSMTHSNR